MEVTIVAGVIRYDGQILAQFNVTVTVTKPTGNPGVFRVAFDPKKGFGSLRESWWINGSRLFGRQHVWRLPFHQRLSLNLRTTTANIWPALRICNR
jgi:hypothetical protein